MLVLCAAITASAYDFMEGGLAYNINDDGTSVTVTYEQLSTWQGWDNELNCDIFTPAYTNLSGALSIPASVTNGGKTYSVTKIGHHAFQACLSLTSVAIPATVTVIENNLFDYCDALVGITVDANNPVYDSRENCNAIIAKQPVDVNNNGQIISYIKDQLAFGCSGSVVPSSVTSIGPYAFRACRTLKSIVIPEGVTTIEYHCFVQSGIESLTLPSTLTQIGHAAFHSCASLLDVYAYFDPANVTYVPNPYNHNYTTWEETLLNPEWTHPVNLHVYPQYVEWFANEYANNLSTTPWASHGYTFNVMGDLGQKLYMHGSYNNWNDVEFEKNAEGKWELKDIVMPADAEFKLVDQNNTWYGATDAQYQITEEALGTSLSLVDGRNFMMAVAGTWTFTVDMDSKTLVVTGEAEQPEPEHVYILGEVNGNGWSPYQGLPMNGSGTTYTANVTTSGENNYFSFTKKLASGTAEPGTEVWNAAWDEILPYRFGAEEGEGDCDVVVGQAMPLGAEGTARAYKIGAGNWTFTLDLAARTFTVTQQGNGNGWFPNVGEKMVGKGNNIYTLDATTDGSSNGFNYFSFTKKLYPSPIEYDETNPGPWEEAWASIADYRFGAEGVEDYPVAWKTIPWWRIKPCRWVWTAPAPHSRLAPVSGRSPST